MSGKHVLFIVTNTHEIGPHKRRTGYFFPEIAHPVEVFERHGVAVEYCSPLGGAPSDDGYDESDPAQAAYRKSKSIRRLARSRRLAEVDVLGVQTGDGAPLVKGRQITGFSNREEENYTKDDVPFMLEDALVAEGARFSAADPWQVK